MCTTYAQIIDLAEKACKVQSTPAYSNICGQGKEVNTKGCRSLLGKTISAQSASISKARSLPKVTCTC